MLNNVLASQVFLDCKGSADHRIYKTGLCNKNKQSHPQRDWIEYIDKADKNANQGKYRF